MDSPNPNAMTPEEPDRAAEYHKAGQRQSQGTMTGGEMVVICFIIAYFAMFFLVAIMQRWGGWE